MWIFGQVWFACLVGFAVGVVLDWVVRVRPLSSRVADLEARLSARSRQDSDIGVADSSGSVFDRGAFSAADSNGFVADRNRGGLLTPSGRAKGSLATDLLDTGGNDRSDRSADGETEVRSGVEDFPGVSRLNSAWESEAEEATRAAPEPPVPWHPNATGEPWQQSGPAVRAAEESWLTTPQPAQQPDESWQDNAEPQEESWQPAVRAPGEDSWLTEPNQAAEQPVDENLPTAEADQQYLEFLRAGANHAPTEPDEDEEELVAHGEVPEPGSTEVTSVLPYPITDDGQPQVDGYEAYENYAQDEYQQNGYQQPQNGYQETYAEPAYQDAGYDLGYQFGEYQPEQVEEPEESTPLPRRGTSGENSMRFTPFAPFELPFGQESEPVSSAQPRNGELTPIEEGGFQPFEKPAGTPESQYETAAGDGAWIGDDGQLVGMSQDGPSSNGSHDYAADMPGPDDASWFDFSDMAAAPAGMEGSMTQRMLPVSRPDLDHPDLLRESVFGTDNDTMYDEEPAPRSLFEPVIAPDELEDDYLAPAGEEPVYEAQGYQEQPYTEQGYQEQQPYQEPYQDQGYQEQGYQEQGGYEAPPMDPIETTGEFLNQAVAPAPHPVRVRTGIDGPATQSIPAMSPVPEPQDHGDDSAAGPFGPGSALPLPDGSAPAPQFRIKARTSSMVFHTESSPFYDRLEPQVWFKDPEDAQRAGFTSWERPRTW
jgi:hypothetical protein